MNKLLSRWWFCKKKKKKKTLMWVWFITSGQICPFRLDQLRCWLVLPLLCTCEAARLGIKAPVHLRWHSAWVYSVPFSLSDALCSRRESKSISAVRWCDSQGVGKYEIYGIEALEAGSSSYCTFLNIFLLTKYSGRMLVCRFYKKGNHVRTYIIVEKKQIALFSFRIFWHIQL